jgi:glycosyltransferase involved in cell wall biosynthesis
LFIIGTGPEDEYLRSLVARKGLEGKIRFLGAIYNPEDLAREIISSAVYVLAGMGGLSINEAMSFGKPVVCSRCDGTEKDLVTEGETGFYFKEGDAVDLAEKIDVLLSDPVRAKIMGSNALSVIQEKINLQTVAQQYVNCFSHVINLARNHGI